MGNGGDGGKEEHGIYLLRFLFFACYLVFVPLYMWPGTAALGQIANGGVLCALFPLPHPRPASPAAAHELPYRPSRVAEMRNNHVINEFRYMCN